MENTDTLFSSLKINTGSNRILVGKSNSIGEVDEILEFSPSKGAYLVRFTDGSEQWINRRNINPVLTNEFDTREFVNEFNKDRDTSQGHAFLYIRTSRPSQKSFSEPDHTDTSSSIEVQKLELSNLARESNLMIQRIGIDTGRSAKDMSNLVGLEFLCEQIEDFIENENPSSPSPVYLYVWNVSRFSRNTLQALNILDKLKSIGVTVFFKEEGVSYDTPAGRHSVRVALSAAQLHSEGTSELVKKVIQLKKRKGTYISRATKKPVAPYGKRLTARGTLEDNPEELAVIKEIVKLYQKCKNPTKVSRAMNLKDRKLRGKNITEAIVKALTS